MKLVSISIESLFLDFMNFVQYLVLFILSSVLLMAEGEPILEESYKHLAENSISTEKQYELANSAMAFGLFENAAEIYESLFWLKGLSLRILIKMASFCLNKILPGVEILTLQYQF